jgi:hypothetical protein
MVWTGVKNGELLRRVAAESFDAFVTVDRNLAFQQNVEAQPFAVLVLRAKTNRLRDLSGLIPNLLAALPMAKAGEVISIDQN